jgi:hypothetical protein
MDVPDLSSTLVLGRVSVQLQIRNGAKSNDTAGLTKLANEALLQKWPVSKRVNRSQADNTLIERRYAGSRLTAFAARRL